MENISLVWGVCPVCGSNLDKDWLNSNPYYGSPCFKCFLSNKPNIFKPIHFKFNVHRMNPSWFLFVGTCMLINGSEWEIAIVTGRSTRLVRTDSRNEEIWIALGYKDIAEIYNSAAHI